MFDSKHININELRENKQKLEKAQQEYNEANSPAGRQKLNIQYEQEINVFNSKEGAMPLWLAYEPENGDLYKAVAK